MKSTSLARASSSAACLLLLLAQPTQAQEAEPASLRFVNVTGVDASLLVRVNGEPLQDRGYRSGEATGRLELSAGPCRIELSLPQHGHAILLLELQPGDARTVVALCEPSRTPSGRQQAVQLTSHVLVKPRPGTSPQRRLQVLQVTPLEQIDLRLAGREIRCHRRRVESFSIDHPQPLLEHAGQPLGRLPFEEAGDATLILFTDAAGHLRRVFFLDPLNTAEPLDRE